MRRLLEWPQKTNLERASFIRVQGHSSAIQRVKASPGSELSFLVDQAAALWKNVASLGTEISMLSAIFSKLDGRSRENWSEWGHGLFYSVAVERMAAHVKNVAVWSQGLPYWWSQQLPRTK